MPATLLCDFYKISHRKLYPPGTEMIYSTWTPRTSRLPNINEVISFGFQAFVKKYLIDFFNNEFFSRPKKNVINEYKRIIKYTLGVKEVETKHIEDLHDLGYLPLKICVIPEGTRVPIRVPMMTVQNTNKKFFWLTNYIETLASTELWLPTTCATIADRYRSIFNAYAKKTGGDPSFVQFQGHDFSMRGMACLEAAMSSGAGHLLSFTGTDCIPAILFLEKYYNANVEKELVGTSIPATEHSVMCAYGQNELESYRHLMTEVHPTGMLSIVSDTWDLWKVLYEVIAPLKETIMNRDGKIVIRPDSGDPVRIICGNPEAKSVPEKKGVVEILWDIFGGTLTSKGYKLLNPHIGAIYGDSITIERAAEMCRRLDRKGFASTNVVYGIGSYSYQYNTRDTFGFALKSTLSIINGKEIQMFKNPITDNGVKKSQKGAVRVFRNSDNVITYEDCLSLNNNKETMLEPIFENGILLKDEKLCDIRNRVQTNQ
ncbi:MAG: nicotinate phosphoribosyltransferase [Nitrospiraceae bacterium]|nr:nicotinate phosphoribosyltransferase [Nitrospiraceae bacterium]